ncbi:hypothetical protein QZH41_007351 [Actinostola sp. cb2023]|nr:hypothetical protein QZH41_007351 [Actinostola sp. cb2023]
MTAFAHTAPAPLVKQESSPTSYKTRLVEAERDKLALELELLKLKSSIALGNQGCEGADFSTQPKKQGRNKKTIDWPQEFCSGASTIEFEKLEMSDFVAGYLVMIKTYESQLKEDMLLIIELLMLKASSYSWKSVRGFYAHIARQVELCRLEFKDHGVIRDSATTYFKHSDLRSNPQQRETTKQNNQGWQGLGVSGSASEKSASSKACRQWNYTGTCKCDSASISYSGHHKCRVCSKEHPMLHCSKRRSEIPDITQFQNNDSS